MDFDSLQEAEGRQAFRRVAVPLPVREQVPDARRGKAPFALDERTRILLGVAASVAANRLSCLCDQAEQTANLGLNQSALEEAADIDLRAKGRGSADMDARFDERVSHR